jgi:hypothetical protein
MQFLDCLPNICIKDVYILFPSIGNVLPVLPYNIFHFYFSFLAAYSLFIAQSQDGELLLCIWLCQPRSSKRSRKGDSGDVISSLPQGRRV